MKKAFRDPHTKSIGRARRSTRNTMEANGYGGDKKEVKELGLVWVHSRGLEEG